MIDETNATIAGGGIFPFDSCLLIASDMFKDFSTWSKRLEVLIVIVAVSVLLWNTTVHETF
jgi:hypothetical protein